MNRLSFERTKRRTHFRLTLERLESRRLMAGLNVVVFSDDDGSRTRSAVEPAAPNRLVYLDLDHSGRFDDGEPLAISGIDGIARFQNLAAGEYFIGLTGTSASQVVTTSVASDAVATLVSSISTSTLISSPDLQDVWSVASDGTVTPLGNALNSDPSSTLPGEFSLAGPLLGVTESRIDSSGAAYVWALVVQGNNQPALTKIDLSAGTAHAVALEGIPPGSQVVGVAMMGDELVIKLDSANESFIALTRFDADLASVTSTIAVPRGRLIGSTLSNHLAIVSKVDEGASGSSFSTLRLADSTAIIATMPLDRTLENVEYSADGQFLFASGPDGGLEVFSTSNGLNSVAYLAEASGPVAFSAADGRLITGNASLDSELIVWDSTSWRLVGRIALPTTTQQGAVHATEPISAITVDRVGERVIAATATSVFTAQLANPAPLAVVIPAGSSIAEVAVGVRVSGSPIALPAWIEVSQTLFEDTLLSIELAQLPELSTIADSSGLFAPSVGPKNGTLLVTPLGRLSYRPGEEFSGRDHVELKVYDGIQTTTLVISLNITAVNDPPTSFTIDTLPVAEAASAGTAAGTTTVYDADSDASYVITTSDPRFYVLNGLLLRSGNGVLDYDREPLVHMTVTATDAADQSISITQSIAVPVLDSNDGPTSFSLVGAQGVPENFGGIDIGRFVIEDSDGHGEYLFTVSDNRFEVAGGQLRLRDGEALDYEREAKVLLFVSLSDPTAERNVMPVLQTLTINVLDRNDLPTGLRIDTTAIHAGVAGAYVGMVRVLDQDAHEHYSYVVSDPRFVVDIDSLRLKPGETVARGAERTVPMMVTATDLDGNSVSQTVTVQVINDAPSQNPRNALDVDNDGDVYPRDVLILINLLNRKGPHIIEPLTNDGEGSEPPLDIFIDVNGDGHFTPLDALILINHLNKRGSGLSGEGENAPTIEWGTKSVDRVSKDELRSPQAADKIDSSNRACSAYAVSTASHLDVSRVAYGPMLTAATTRVIDAELESLLDELTRERLR